MTGVRRLVAWLPALVALLAIAGMARAVAAPPATDRVEAAASDPAPRATMRPAGPEFPRAPELRDDRSKIVLPPMVIPREPPGVDRRPIYVGAALIALAVVSWWNRRRRDRFVREDGAHPARGRPSRRRGGRSDDDAGDLHAAARGEGPRPPEAPGVPEMAVPEIEVPEIEVPEIEVPEMNDAPKRPDPS